MTEQERSVHAQVTHMGSHQRDAMLRIARGAKVNKQTVASLESRGWITHTDYKDLAFTPDGSTALKIIGKDFS